MKTTRCNICGSTNLRADRALAGRLICNQCGSPVGSSYSFGLSRRKQSYKRTNNLNILILLFLVVALIVIFL